METKSDKLKRRDIKGIKGIELLEWAKRLGVRLEVLREAVRAVGDDTLKVNGYLKARKGRDGDSQFDNRDQWIQSFKGQLSILRPHLTLRVLISMSNLAWQKHGTQDKDPIKAAKDWSKSLDSASTEG